MSRFENWSREQLITRLTELEDKSISNAKPTKGAWGEGKKAFDFAAHPRRKIALRFCYSGWLYNGLAIQEGPTPLPTVEGVLFNALATVRLIDPAEGMEGCQWERCGRTDVGVSGAGQVVSLWVRSALKEFAQVPVPEEEPLASSPPGTPRDDEVGGEFDFAETSNAAAPPKLTDKPEKEIAYIKLLNNVLPPSIRIMAWSAVGDGFSARFSCKYRHYKYFFTSDGLDIARMQDAASRLLGERDFRNLCKLDPGKQITDFRRTILRAEISRANSIASFDAPESLASKNTVYVFDLIGTAFLYHQVRHIMAILFLVGTGLEPPSVMSALVNTNPDAPCPSQRPNEPPPELVTARPVYQKADALPLVLWDCAYHESDVRWRTDVDETNSDSSPSFSASTAKLHDLSHELHSIHARTLTQTILEEHFHRSAAPFYQHTPNPLPLRRPDVESQCEGGDNVAPLTKEGIQKLGLGVLRIPLGGGSFARTGQYTPLLLRKRLDPVEVVNARWLLSKGARRKVKMEVKEAGEGSGEVSGTRPQGSRRGRDEGEARGRGDGSDADE